MRDKQDIRERIKYETELLRLALLAAIGAVGGVVGLILVLSPYDFDGFMTVMPAQTGIQESQAEASGYPAWIPAFAGMTQPRSTPQIHTDGLLGETTLLCAGLAGLGLVAIVVLIGIAVRQDQRIRMLMHEMGDL